MDSDKTPTMHASTVFFKIIDQIQSSNLNFQLQISPFSAKISLKKSWVRDRTGAPLLPPDRVEIVKHNDDSVENFAAKNLELEEKLLLLQNKYQQVEDESAKAYEMIDMLECKVAKAEANALEITKLDTYKECNEALQIKINKLELEISDFKRAKLKALEVSARLKKDLNDHKLKFSTEMAVKEKRHKEEVKAWKKSLGEANKEKIKMQQQFENKLGEEVAVKNVEIKKVCDEKAELEEKVNSLLDSLYSCNYCGRQACALECEEYEEFLEAENAVEENAYNENVYDAGQDISEQSKNVQLISLPAMGTAATSVTPSNPPPQSSSWLPPWTPPPTPPCSSCGADNYGPCPGSVCFSCIPNVQKSSPTRSSPSTTPPGTPPLLRRSHQLTPSSRNQL